MEPAPKRTKWLVLAGILLAVPFGFLLLRTGEHTYVTLPYYGPREAHAPGDTTYFKVPPFRFTDSHGRSLSDAQLEGKVLVVDFFFTRCTTICPRMNAQMQQLLFRLDDPAYAHVVCLSHTVDPEHDTPDVLHDHARKMKADSTRWKFVTGPKEALYLQGAEGYFLAAREDVMAPDGFLHSDQFVLVDRRRHIRGYYDGTNTSEIDRLVNDIKILTKEENARAREAATAK
jgi:protein SCO1